MRTETRGAKSKQGVGAGLGNHRYVDGLNENAGHSDRTTLAKIDGLEIGRLWGGGVPRDRSFGSVKWDFVSGLSNDIVSLFIDPVGSIETWAD